MGPNEVESRGLRLMLEDGVLHAVIKRGQTKTKMDVERNIAACREILDGLVVPILFDIRASEAVNIEVRHAYANGRYEDLTNAVAVLVDSVFTRTLANVGLRLAPPRIPVRVFDARDAALEWLAEQEERER